ncbi:MAG: CBS domain-containing protein [Pseudomonadota bacterium]
MNVAQILKTKAMDGVLTCRADVTVKEAAEIMSERRIGTLVISDDDSKTPQGILSERDIVRHLGARGTDVLVLPISEIMTSKLVTCTASDTSESVLEQMISGRFRHMPVLQDGELIGLVSIGDVVKAQLAQVAMERDALTDMVMGH